MDFPKKLLERLEKREHENALRILSSPDFAVDFYSNDYIGFARSKEILEETHEFLKRKQTFVNGSTGSRLISGNHAIYDEAETFIAEFHDSESALIFNSGYDANIGFFSCVPQRSDIILYDELCHASIRDGIGLSRAKSFKFTHNDLEELEKLIEKFQSPQSDIYIVTESVFSMDGDSPNLEELCRISKKHNGLLVIDEAHALGVFGENGSGLVQQLGLQHEFFARLMTFGKGLGCHGSAILGSKKLCDYLVNFSRSFIYTTALPPHSVATILTAYKRLEASVNVYRLSQIIAHFNQEKNRLSLKPMFVYSKSAIQCAIIPGNEKVKQVADKLQQKGFGVKAILSPTVPQGQERLRICLHSYNSEEEVTDLLDYLATLVF
ncbi:pyridoxal phosphate-dependent aminotransferase family protein [Flavobacterium sp. MAH-1]|uniref:Pyridoxal phosphate-dependent aminotransferase family protein n=1 Tax=Flavobacterium agri TaxID=2743471 RepID=A0A7Y9C6K6_9FLAO|nr:pyridoxal phosphate-dependent aminotransferase family protein [Flavobacterium agri]NUY80312.1 pyridoxal phosphate-dependent aminotransferase family protein [Flavobacterium agri]NYA70337.1 pyridoxal phosphate-dependent aminotransferase family protein [Flavobacterium agri]